MAVYFLPRHDCGFAEQPLINPFSPLPLFVFGTLRRGESNHHILAGRFERWLPATLRDFRRTTTMHGFPAITPSPGDHVTGELFFIRPADFAETLHGCDILEDLLPGQLTGPYYQRARVNVETAEGSCTAWSYIDPTVAPPQARPVA